MQAADLLELRDDLTRETRRLEQLVESLLELESRLGSNSETVEAAALFCEPLIELGRATLQQHAHGIGVEHEALLHGQPLS